MAYMHKLVVVESEAFQAGHGLTKKHVRNAPQPLMSKLKILDQVEGGMAQQLLHDLGKKPPFVSLLSSFPGSVSDRRSIQNLRHFKHLKL